MRNQILFANTVFRQVAYRPDEAQLLTVGTDRKAGYWEAFDGSLIREVEVSVSGALNALDISADGLSFVVGGDDRLIKVCIWSFSLSFFSSSFFVCLFIILLFVLTWVGTISMPN